jgi:hypothetical protein
MLGTMSAVKELAADFDAVTDGFAFSMRADRRNQMYRAFEAVEDHGAAVRTDELKSLVMTKSARRSTLCQFQRIAARNRTQSSFSPSWLSPVLRSI